MACRLRILAVLGLGCMGALSCSASGNISDPSAVGTSDAEIRKRCGNGRVEGAEQCEAPFDLCCDPATCRYRAAGTECRAAADDCDVGEMCTGSSAVCPTDRPAPDDTTCSSPAGGRCRSGTCTEAGIPAPTAGGLPAPTDGGIPAPTDGGIPAPTDGGIPAQRHLFRTSPNLVRNPTVLGAADWDTYSGDATSLYDPTVSRVSDGSGSFHFVFPSDRLANAS